MVDGCTSPATVLVEHEFSCGGGGFEANIPNDQFVCDGHAWKMTNSRSWQFLGVLTLITGAVVAAFFARIGWHQASMSGWVLSGVGLLIMLAVAVWQEKNAMSVKSAYRTSVRGEFGTVWEDKVIEGKCTQVSSTFSKKATPSRLLSQGFVFNSVVLVVATAAHVFIAPPLPRDLAKPADLPQAPRVGYAAGDAHWRTTLTREFHDGWADHAAALQYIAGLDQWTLRSATHQIGFVEGENSFSVWVDESPEMSCFAVSPDGQLVGIGDDSGKVRVLSRADGHLIGEIQLTDALPITHLVFPETGPLLAIVTGNNFHVWDRMANASVLRRSVHCDRDRDIQLSPDGTRVIWRSVTDDLYIADLATAEKIQPIAASKVTAFDYCWQRELLVTTSQENRQVTFFRGPSFQCVGRLLPSFVPQAISLSVDGQFLAMSVRRLNSEEPNELLVWNLEKNAADWLLESRANNSRPVVDISPVIRLKDEFHSEEPIQTFGFGNDNRLYVVSGSTFRVREFVSDSRRGDWVSVQLQRTATGTASTSGPPNPGVSTPIPLFRESRRLLADATTLDEEFARVAEKQLCQIRESELPDLFRYLDGPCPTFANLAERAILKADVSCDVKLQMLLPELRGEDQQRQGRSARMISSLTCDISTETLLDVASYFLDALLAPPESQADQTGGEQSGRWTQLAQVMSRLIDAPRAGSAAHDARVVGIVSRLQQLHEAYRDTDHAGVAEQLFVQSGKWLLSFEQIDLRGIDELLRADRLLATSASLRQFAFQQSVALPESEMSSRLATMLEGPHGELRLKAARHLAQSNIPVTPIGVNILAAIEDCRFRAAREEATPELVDLLQCLGKLRGDALPALPHVIKLTKLAGKEDERAAAQRTVEVLAPHFTAEIVKMLSAKRPMSQQDLGSKLRLLPQLGSSARSAFEPMFEALRWQTDDTLEDSTVRSNVLTTLQTLQQLKAGEDLAAGGDLRILVTLYFASGRAKSNRQVRDASIDFLLQAGREGVRQVLEISNKLRRNDGRLEEIQSKIVDHHETVVPTLRSALKGDTAGEPPWNRTAIIKTLTLLGPAAKAALPELRNELTDRKISPAYSKLVQDALNAISSSDSP